jgi:hypothetical protein
MILFNLFAVFTFFTCVFSASLEDPSEIMESTLKTGFSKLCGEAERDSCLTALMAKMDKDKPIFKQISDFNRVLCSQFTSTYPVIGQEFPSLKNMKPFELMELQQRVKKSLLGGEILTVSKTESYVSKYLNLYENSRIGEVLAKYALIRAILISLHPTKIQEKEQILAKLSKARLANLIFVYETLSSNQISSLEDFDSHLERTNIPTSSKIPDEIFSSVFENELVIMIPYISSSHIKLLENLKKRSLWYKFYLVFAVIALAVCVLLVQRKMRKEVIDKEIV